MILRKTADGWNADFAGSSFPMRVDGNEIGFDLPAGGSFRSRIPRDGSAIVGHWTSPPSPVNGFLFAVPVPLTPDGPDRLRGVVEPRDDAFTLYLMVQPRSDGTFDAFLRNPERNLGVQYGVERIVRNGDSLELIGKRQGQAEQGVILRGTLDAKAQTFSIDFEGRGGTYVFHRDDDHSDFYPRGKNPGRYVYSAPPARDDGWPTATLDDVDIDRAGIETFIQALLDMPIESVATPEVHGILIARHGKLVLEEYFHGENRDKMHDTRSAAKSLTATVAGAAIADGAPLKLSTPVYEIMNGGTFPPDLDPRKRAMTLEHLLTMSSGYFCDDSNPDAPGNENTMLDQSDEPDYYRYTLRLPIDSAPGEKTVYCSIDPNLALGMVSRATGESPMDTFDRLIGPALKIDRYAWILDPAGHPYGGGSVQFKPRDFMKLGQLMLDGGTAHGKRVLSRDYVARASSPLRDLNSIQYGFLWWNIEYPYKNRSVRAYFAGGNGGQG
ncbi:MAG: serine hydrolase domain-containing protein, partial [Rhodanobacteraceae bacterium]